MPYKKSRRSRHAKRTRRTRRVSRGGEFRMSELYTNTKVMPNPSNLPPTHNSPAHFNTVKASMNVKNWNGNAKPKTWRNRLTMSNATRKRMNNVLFRMTPSQQKQEKAKELLSQAANVTKRGALKTANLTRRGASAAGRGAVKLANLGYRGAKGTVKGIWSGTKGLLSAPTLAGNVLASVLT